MKHEKSINRQRQRRRFRNRNAVKRHSTRPRLSVFRSHKHIYAQIIDDQAGKTLAAACSLDKQVSEQLSYGGNKQAAAVVGEALARRALEAGVTQAAFDRREYKYHGRIEALARAARLAGLDLGAEAEPEQAKPDKPQGKKKGDKGKGKAKGEGKGKAKGEGKGEAKGEGKGKDKGQAKGKDKGQAKGKGKAKG